MTTETVIGMDTVAANIDILLADIPRPIVVAGYDTEVGPGAGIAWNDAQYATVENLSLYPPLHIAQLPTGNPPTSDYLDIESGAATTADIATWVPAALRAYETGARPGQRRPALYVEGSELTPAANELKAAGIESGVGFVLTKPMSQAQATAMVATGSGPYPIVGVQFGFPGPYDVDVFSVNWLTDVSKAALTWVTISVGNMTLPVLSASVVGAPNWVCFMQGALNVHAGRLSLLADGIFGPATTARVKGFQSNNGLTADGICGKETWEKLL